MNNLAMKRKLENGEAWDLAPYQCEGSLGMYQIPQHKWQEMESEEYDLCDAPREQWIWSVGQCIKTWRSTRDDGLTMLIPVGTILASTSSILYQHPSFKCLWLR